MGENRPTQKIINLEGLNGARARSKQKAKDNIKQSTCKLGVDSHFRLENEVGQAQRLSGATKSQQGKLLSPRRQIVKRDLHAVFPLRL